MLLYNWTFFVRKVFIMISKEKCKIEVFFILLVLGYYLCTAGQYLLAKVSFKKQDHKDKAILSVTDV